MTERKATHVALESVDVQRWKPHVRDLLESVLDVARRLGHNLVDVEHFLVAGAELGVEEMAKAVPIEAGTAAVEVRVRVSWEIN